MYTLRKHSTPYSSKDLLSNFLTQKAKEKKTNQILTICLKQIYKKLTPSTNQYPLQFIMPPTRSTAGSNANANAIDFSKFDNVFISYGDHPMRCHLASHFNGMFMFDFTVKDLLNQTNDAWSSNNVLNTIHGKVADHIGKQVTYCIVTKVRAR